MQFPTRQRGNLIRPIVALQISVGETAPLAIEALIDTGADRTIFPAYVARHFNLSLSGPTSGEVKAAVGGSSEYWLHEVTLQFRRYPESLKWQTEVCFVDRPMQYALLGSKSFFEFFDLSYSFSRETIDITPASPIVNQTCAS